MLFNKNLLSVAILASAMVAGSAFAADEPAKQGATVTFKAQIRAASCDVTSTTKGSIIDWGVFTQDQIQTKAVKDQLGDTEKFDLILTNCSKDATDTNMFVYASGEEALRFPGLFANSDVESLAVKLVSGAVDILPNKDAGIVLPEALKKADGATIPMEASLLLTQAGNVAKAGVLNVPVTFTVSYN